MWIYVEKETLINVGSAARFAISQHFNSKSERMFSVDVSYKTPVKISDGDNIVLEEIIVTPDVKVAQAVMDKIVDAMRDRDTVCEIDTANILKKIESDAAPTTPRESHDSGLRCF